MKKSITFPFADGPKELNEGDKVYKVYNYSRQESSELVVKKIGRTLITCADYREYQYYIANGRIKSDYSNSVLYSSKEAYEAFQKATRYIEEVTRFLNDKKMTLEQAKQIAEILGFKE